MIWLLLLSLIAILTGGLLSLDLLLGSGVVSCIAVLAAFRCRPRWLALVLGLWLEAVIAFLVTNAGDQVLSWFGIPRPAFWMLVGIWLLPVLIWPLGFALFFRRWMGRE